MKVLVTGVAGQLGWDVVRALEKRHIECLGVDYQDFDLTDRNAVLSFVQRYAPTDIVHCAAYTAVDKAEADKETCFAVNRLGTANLAEAARVLDARMVYISTDYVFPGTGEKYWEVDDPKEPQNVYGLSKLQGEEAVAGLLEKFFILRTSWVFGFHGKNFVRTMLSLAEQHDALRVVCDQIGSPTYTVDLARVICDLLETEKYGYYHVRNEQPLSWADFAKMIMQKAHKACRIIPVPSAEYATAARRPLNSRLSAKALAAAGIAPMPTVENALDRYLAELAAEKQ